MKLSRPRYFQYTPKTERGAVWRALQALRSEVLVADPWIWFVALFMAVVVGYMLPSTLKFTAAGFMGLSIVALSAAAPKRALYGVWLLMVLEGAVRKWLFPGVQEFIYFGKDVIIGGIYAGVVLRNLTDIKTEIVEVPTWIKAALWVTVIYVVAQLANPRLVSPLIGIFGLRNYIFYLGLPLVVPYLFQGRADFYKFLKFNFVVAFLVCILGAVQYSLPRDHAINKYGNTMHQMDIAAFSDEEGARTRITGPFSYITGFTSYLTILALMAFPFVFTSGGRTRWLYSMLMVALMGNILMTGSRGPLLLVILAIPGFVQLATFGTHSRREASMIRRRLYLRIGLVGFVSVLAAQTVFHEPFQGVLDRFDTHRDSDERLANLYRTPFEIIEDTGLFGYGPAMTHQAREALLRISGTWAILPSPAEEEPIRIMKEIGLLGFFIWYALRALFLWWNWLLILREKDGFFRLVLIAIFMVQWACLPTSTVINHTQLFLYWFLLAAMRIPREAPILRRKRRKYLL